MPPHRGDFALNGGPPESAFIAQAKPAAVLAPLVLSGHRPQCRAHPAQCRPARSFRPDRVPRRKNRSGRNAARCGAPRGAGRKSASIRPIVEPLGWLDPYLTGTGYRIAPLVGLVDPAFIPVVNPDEVDEAFETPFAFLMDPANHKLDQREWQGKVRRFYAMPHEGRYIWGATAGILRNLYERLFSP